jgi:hypothetical protein
LQHEVFKSVAVSEDVVEKIAAYKNEEVGSPQNYIGYELFDRGINNPASTANGMPCDNTNNGDGPECF